MILSIDSTLKTFKSVRFHEGLNVLLSDKSSDGDNAKTRNSAGKSSLVEIVHFLLGAKADPDSLLRHEALNDAVFHGVFQIAGRRVEASRSGTKHGRICLDAATVEHFALPTKPDKETGARTISNEEWKAFLAHHMFDFPEFIRGSAFEDSFSPSFRSLVGYFARRDGSGGFAHVERQAELQSRWDWQVNLSYLLGLDWQIPRALQLVKKREGQLGELKKAVEDGTFGVVIGSVGELRDAVAHAEVRAVKLRGELARFQVLEAYREMMDQATRAKVEIQAIARRTVPLRETVAHLKASIEAERIPERSDVGRLYASVGIELPEVAVRSFDDVARFHKAVVENRRLHLREEIEGIERQIAEGEARSATLDAQRGEILRMLDGHGALEDFVVLQKRLAEAEAELASLKERFKSAEALASQTTELTIERIGIKRRLQEDHQQRRERLDRAILLVGGAIQTLYEDRKGRFEIEATENGPEFRITIQGDRGGGISNMEIFCLDYAIFSIWTTRSKGPGFLIHDSHLFDPVDPRQVARALGLAGGFADLFGGQYIVALNSDVYDRLELPDGIDREAAVVTPRLSDADETSGLFGFRFD
ncbi:MULTISPECIES: ABC-three component system protein [unclassified Methylobacterium]|jgi:uncharacterized protein YydD (DUF2326 family)|uniref:ABC-three component system protein n=1 Tax=unclassified Methylobacterium TaxID=2615210 RepID=UPI0005B822AA|nr:MULTISPECIES: ABC-three component system protein [unclassified Methylobacterium]SFU96768.1 Uncharacterized protein YydD, contains DUF2326 domain [Methylobacterium sp. UNCCL125]